ncbi:primosomal protein N' [Alteribacillus sp. HJP-4]|uniref:primosomal protein N' n=1 Tax=Alteribacillus sp. HJP-4 TaxID=2775394 RepID=UPI0035CCFA58
MYAKVIVDVAAAQINKAFDYKIPEEMIDLVKPGMRVTVPFGPRKIQGFIWKTSPESNLSKVKGISDILDPDPVLTKELLELGHWLSEETVCFLITAYQSMIPSAIRAKPKKKIRLTGDAAHLPEPLQQLFNGKHQLEWEKLTDDKKLIRLIKLAADKGTLEIDYVVKNQTNKKRVALIHLDERAMNRQASELVSSSAKKQLSALEWMQNNACEKAVPQQELIEKASVTTQVIKALTDKNLLIRSSVESYRDPYAGRTFAYMPPLELTARQRYVLRHVHQSIDEKKHVPFLLRGVTGSGKTEVYLQAIQKVMESEKEAIVLVPEISLTPQMVERFKGRFGSNVAVMHSALSAGEKYDEWRKIHRKEVKVVVGARSAVFAPFENLGLIIIDEEHEGSYKQEDHPRYHARQVALWRGRYHNCPVLLGSATPSLESYARAKREVYTLLELPDRVNDMQLPDVQIIDMRQELKNGNRSVFSGLLLEKIKDRLEKKEQIVLFLNRRGYSTFVMCRSCGYTAECPHCEITLTYHHTQSRLKCHYCGHEEHMITECPACESEQIRFFGTGTQKVEEEITKLLPEARVIRMDVDTTTKKGSHEKMLSAFGRGEADILLGTQMIAKGLDFPRITLAGVLAADTLLNLPDFRAPERTFQLLTQVSGRAGRDTLKGEVVVQSYNPDHYSIQHAKEHDFPSFCLEEMGQRKRGGYPPYYYIALINVAHEDVTKVIQTSDKIAGFLKQSLSKETKVLGPTVSPIARMKDRYRYQCMIKYRNEPNVVKVLNEILNRYQKEIAGDKLFISIDMNPQMFM